MTRDRRILLLGSLAAMLLLVAGGLWLSRGAAPGFEACRKNGVAGRMPVIDAPFTLTDQNGARISSRQIFTKPAFVYFGYTYCPDVCPLDAARNSEAVSILDKRGIEVTPVLISVDPERDTPEALGQFVAMLHPRMIGLTGSVGEIDAVARQWRSYYRLNNQEDDEYYMVDHMTNTYLVMPDAGVVESFDRDMGAQDMADRSECFIRAAG
ncbi:protein SCO1/2 [Paracoccus halophilus]|uniref:Protein SCO1/2 n=2 Tax=Paracoccus halophilus TaxID=376733 RepID=A0A099F6D7_9RHOB|nr:protein senC [Paracoccus halophilus]SFA47859.1 protein SCO1/2 [Paracoccus halophilus]